MSEQRHRTVLEIGVDDRQLRSLGQTLDKALSEKAVDAFEKSLERTAASMQKIVEAQNKLLKGQEDLARRARSPQGGRRGGLTGMLVGMALGTGGGLTGAADAMAGAGLSGEYGASGRMAGGAWLGGRGIGRLAHAGATHAGNLGGALMNEGFTSSIFGGLPYIGPVISGAIGGAQSFYAAHVARARARAGAFGQTRMGNAAYKGISNPYGLGPSELPGTVGSFAEAAGVRGLGEIAPRLGLGMDLANLAGIDYGATGTFMRASGGAAQGRARSASAETRGTMETLSAAIVAGVEESQLGQVLSNLGSTFEELQTQGFNVSPESLNGMIRGFSRLGPSFGGMAGVRAATGFQSAMRGVAMNPQDDLFQMGLFRAAGYGTDASLHTARERLAGESREVSQADILRRFFIEQRGHLRDPNDRLSQEALAGTYMRGFSGMGAQLSPSQARRLAETDFSVDASGTDEIEYILEGLREEAGNIFGTNRAEARYENRRANMGAITSGLVRQVRGLEMSTIESTLGRVAPMLAQAVAYLNRMLTAFQQGGVEGVMGLVSPDLGAIADRIGERLDAALARILPEGVDPTELAPMNLHADIVSAIREGLVFLQPLADALERLGFGGRNATPTTSAQHRQHVEDARDLMVGGTY